MAWGGSRKGSGRKKGASFRDMVSRAEKAKYVEFVLSTYMESPDLTKWMGDQLFGKAPTSIDLTSGGEKILTPLLDRGVSKDKRA